MWVEGYEKYYLKFFVSFSSSNMCVRRWRLCLKISKNYFNCFIFTFMEYYAVKLKNMFNQGII